MPKQVIDLSKVQVTEALGVSYLRLELERGFSVAIQLNLVQETFVIQRDRLTLLPNVDPCLLGLLEHRSSIFWVVDLPLLLGSTALDAATVDYNIAVLRVRGELLGLAIRQIGQVVRFTDEEIYSPVEVDLPAKLTPFLRGTLSEPDGNIYILDAEAIACTNFS